MAVGPFPTIEDEVIASEVRDALTLQREYGIDVVKAWTELPHWYVDLLLAAATMPEAEGAPGPPSDGPEYEKDERSGRVTLRSIGE